MSPSPSSPERVLDGLEWQDCLTHTECVDPFDCQAVLALDEHDLRAIQRYEERTRAAWLRPAPFHRW